MLTVQNYEQKIAPTDTNITIHIIGDVLADVRVEKRFLLPIDMKPFSDTRFEFRDETLKTDHVQILDASIKTNSSVYEIMRKKTKIQSQTSKDSHLSLSFTSSNSSREFTFSSRYAIRIFQNHLILPQSILRSTHKTVIKIESMSCSIQSINSLPTDTDIVVKDRKATISISREVISDAIVRIETSTEDAEEEEEIICVAKYRDIALMKRVSSKEYFQDREVVVIATRAFARAYVARSSHIT